MTVYRKKALELAVQIEATLEVARAFRDALGRSEGARLVALSITDLESATNWLTRFVASEDEA